MNTVLCGRICAHSTELFCVNVGSRSELLEYIDQTESGKPKKELSPKEQVELDNVEKNIRRIHRK